MFLVTSLSILISLQLQCFSVEATGVRCFECHEYPSPTLCTDITTCTDDDMCFVEEYVTTSANIVFNSGCMNKNRCAGNVGKRGVDSRMGDILLCSTCCTGNLCNNEGCGQHALPFDQRGPYCFSCDFMLQPDKCDKVTVCQPHQQCGLYTPKEFHQYPTTYYTASCLSNETCAVVSNTSSTTTCIPNCCNHDFCNTACGTPLPTTTTTVTPSTVSTTFPTSPTTISVPTTTPSSTSTASKTSTTKATTTKATTTKATTSITTTKATTSTTTTKATTSKPPCAIGGYHEVPNANGLCIQVFYMESTWKVAQSVCQQFSGDLVILDTEPKIRGITEYLKHHHEQPGPHIDNFWIGAYDRYHTDIIQWVDGQLVSATAHNWHDDHQPGPGPEHHPPGPEHHPPGPEPAGHREDCVLMERHEFKWRDVKCDEQHTGFVCERK